MTTAPSKHLSQYPVLYVCPHVFIRKLLDSFWLNLVWRVYTDLRIPFFFFFLGYDAASMGNSFWCFERAQCLRFQCILLGIKEPWMWMHRVLSKRRRRIAQWRSVVLQQEWKTQRHRSKNLKPRNPHKSVKNRDFFFPFYGCFIGLLYVKT